MDMGNAPMKVGFLITPPTSGKILLQAEKVTKPRGSDNCIPSSRVSCNFSVTLESVLLPESKRIHPTWPEETKTASPEALAMLLLRTPSTLLSDSAAVMRFKSQNVPKHEVQCAGPEEVQQTSESSWVITSEISGATHCSTADS